MRGIDKTTTRKRKRSSKIYRRPLAPEKEKRERKEERRQYPSGNVRVEVTGANGCVLTPVIKCGRKIDRQVHSVAPRDTASSYGCGRGGGSRLCGSWWLWLWLEEISVEDAYMCWCCGSCSKGIKRWRYGDSECKISLNSYFVVRAIAATQ